MPSTFVHGFVPAACAYYSRRGVARLTRAQGFRFFLLAFILGNSPDLDLIPATIFSQYWKEIHREWGHNLFTMTLWIILGANVMRVWVSREIPKTVAYLAAAGLVFSHVMFDAMGAVNLTGERAGVPLLWPFTEYEFNLPVVLFRGITLHTHASRTLPGQVFVSNPFWQHVTSVEFWTELFVAEVMYGALIFVAWACVWRVGRALNAARLRLRNKKGTAVPDCP